MSLNRALLSKIMEQAKKKPKKFRVPRNQWQHPGEVTDVNSPNITMQGVSYPVLGVSPDGTQQMMYPGGNYNFPSYPVREYPMIPKAQDGMEIDFRSVRQPRYDNIKSPNAKLEKLLKEDAVKMAAADKRKYGAMKNVPNGLLDKAERAVRKTISTLGMPMTALSYVAKGQRIPDNFDKADNLNPYDFAVASVNPFDPLYMAQQSYDDMDPSIALFSLMAGTGAAQALRKGSKAKELYKLADAEESVDYFDMVKNHSDMVGVTRPPLDNPAVSSKYKPFTFENRKFSNPYKKDQASDALYRTISDETQLENQEALDRLVREAKGYKKPKGASKIYDNLGEFLDENQMRVMLDRYGYNPKMKGQNSMLDFLFEKMDNADFNSFEEKLLDRYNLKNKFRNMPDERVAKIYQILRDQHQANAYFDKEAYARMQGIGSPAKSLAKSTLNSEWDSGKQLINNKDWFATAPADELVAEMKNIMPNYGFDPSKVDDAEKFRTFYRNHINKTMLDQYTKKPTSRIFEGLSNNKYGGTVKMQDGGGYEQWFKYNTREGKAGVRPYDSRVKYDYQQYFEDMRKGKATYIDPTTEDHYEDTYKLPGHPSFSVESMYYKGNPKKQNVISWDGNFNKSKSKDMYSFYDLMKYQDGGAKRQWHPEWDENPLAAYDIPMSQDEDLEMARLHQAGVAAFPQRVPEIKVKDDSYQGHSIVDFLQSYGYGSDYASRKAFAEALGIGGYKGTAAQNLKLLASLKDNVALLKQYRPVAPSTAKKKMTKSNSVAQTSKEVPVGDMFETAKSAYLLSHPGMTSEDYDSRMGLRENASLGVGKPASNRAVPGKFVDKTLDRMRADAQAGLLPSSYGNEYQAQFSDALIDFFAKEVPLMAAGPLAGKALKGIHWGSKMYPYNPYQIPEVVQASRNAARAIGYKKGGGTYYQGNFYKQGGPVVGDEMEVTPQQLEALRQQGYDFEII